MTRRQALLVFFASSTFVGLAVLSTRPRAEESKELVVAAAASLREVFQRLATNFEKQHPGVTVCLNFAGSQELRVQIENGAQVDVFASADEKHMGGLEKQGLVKAPVLFAQNEPVVVVPSHNPARLASFADLGNAEHLVLGAADVPIGAYTDSILSTAARVYGPAFRSRVLGHVRSRELNVRQVLTKVILGEADAGIVYRTDALTAKGRVMTFAIPEDVNVVAAYPIAIVTGARHAEAAEQWIALVRSKAGQSVLTAAGFTLPAAPPIESTP